MQQSLIIKIGSRRLLDAYEKKRRISMSTTEQSRTVISANNEFRPNHRDDEKESITRLLPPHIIHQDKYIHICICI